MFDYIIIGIMVTVCVVITVVMAERDRRAYRIEKAEKIRFLRECGWTEAELEKLI